MSTPLATEDGKPVNAGNPLPVTEGNGSVYESIEYALVTASTNDSVKTNHAGFAIVTTARNVIIRTDQTITVKFNASGNNSITLTAAASPLSFDSLQVTDIFVTNTSGVTANIKIILT